MRNYDYIESNLISLRKRIEAICSANGRNPKEIYIIAVSKTFPADAVSSALDYNQLDFGENKVQELMKKQKELEGRILHWHLVGRLQTNKVKYIVPFIFLIHSVDNFKLALKIQDEASKRNLVVKCLVQVNTSGGSQKSGCEVAHTLKLVKEISNLENVRVKGLMTIAKMIDKDAPENEKNIVRENFKTLRELFNEIKSLNILKVDMKYLSMGMTSDYNIAIEEGSNMLRLG
ncbi:MAG: YggS family pyridoxal phosphate-dependent enzyme, partial [Ignavibacteria bacterium]